MADLSIDGPHSPQSTREAAALAAEAIRVLNHATGHHRDAGLKWASDVDSVTGSLAELAMRLPQLLGQLGEWLGRECEAGGLRVSYGPYKGDPAGAAAMVSVLLGEASQAAGLLHERLNEARQVTATIGGWDRDGDDVD